MNQDQVSGIIRAIAPALLAYLVGKGWVGEGSVADITAAAVAIGAAIWSFFNNTTAHKMTASIHEPTAVEVAKKLPPTIQVRAVAEAMKEVPPRV